MDFKDTKDMDIGLKYQAIESGHVMLYLYLLLTVS